MAKKPKDDGPNVNATTNRDIVQRLNFLYQASVYLQSIAPSSTVDVVTKLKEVPKASQEEDQMVYDNENTASSSLAKRRRKGKNSSRRTDKKRNTGDLARSYIQCMRAVGQKTTVKIDPSLKRSLCSSCNTTLVPGSSTSVRLKTSSCHGHIVVYTCLHCKSTKRIPAPPTAPKINSDRHDPLHSTSSNVKLSLTEEKMATHSQPTVTRRSTKKKVKPRPLPLFARADAGHVVFSGNSQLSLDPEGGSGTAFA